MKQVEAQPLGAVSHLWAESPRWLPSKAPWDCWPSAEQQSICFYFVLFCFCSCERKSSLCFLLPRDLRCLRERQFRLQNCFLSSSSLLGAQPTQGSHLTLLLNAALPAVSLPPKCLIRANAPFPVPTATS